MKVSLNELVKDFESQTELHENGKNADGKWIMRRGKKTVFHLEDIIKIIEKRIIEVDNKNTMSETIDQRSVNCIFCDIIRRAQVPVMDIEPLNPVVEGHRIVFAARHSSDFTDDDTALMHVMHHAAYVARKNGGEYNLITSKGKNATQSVFHLHVHIIPRTKDDGLKLPWSDQDLQKVTD